MQGAAAQVLQALREDALWGGMVGWPVRVAAMEEGKQVSLNTLITQCLDAVREQVWG